jgi:uncharacterized protein
LIAEFVLFLVIGCGIGFLGGLFGVGGAITSIPILGIFFGMSEQEAQGTSLVMVVSNVGLALWHYSHQQRINVRMAIVLAVVAIPFAYLGARYATLLPEQTLRYAFASFVVVIALYMMWRLLGTLPTPKRPFPFPFVGVVGAISGLMAGAFGIGGAMFTIPAMSILFGLSQVAAQGLALALGVPGALVGLATYAAAKDIDWSIGIALALGGLATVQTGAHLAHRIPDRTLRWLWIAFLFIAAAALVVHHV